MQKDHPTDSIHWNIPAEVPVRIDLQVVGQRNWPVVVAVAAVEEEGHLHRRPVGRGRHTRVALEQRRMESEQGQRKMEAHGRIDFPEEAHRAELAHCWEPKHWRKRAGSSDNLSEAVVVVVARRILDRMLD